YGATSMRDLITHLGLSSSSIYAAFGGKYGLFMAALEHGAAQDRAMIVAALDHPAGMMAGITALYDGLIDSLVAEEPAAASLTLRAALEHLENDGQGAQAAGQPPEAREPDVLAALRVHLADLSSLVAQRLDQAQERGELRLNQAASDLALFILLNAFNLTFVVKLTHDRDRLAAYVRAALDAVAAPDARPRGGRVTGA